MTISAEKKLGHNTTFKQGATTIQQCTRIKIPGYDRGEVDVTSLDSTIQDFVVGDPPEITECTVDLIWVSGLTSQELIETSVRAKTTTPIRLSFRAGQRAARSPSRPTRRGPTRKTFNPRTRWRSQYRLRPTSVVTVT
jgi:hypothetical protein